MEFKRSIQHPDEIFETDPDFPYTFRPRMSNTAHLTANACWKCRDDLTEAGWKGSLPVACLNDISGHFVAAIFPEGLADKFGPLSYLSEYAFIHDERVDEACSAEEFEKAHQTMWTFIGKSESDASNSMIKSIQARMVLDLYKGDPDVADRIMRYYQGFLGVKSPERDTTLFKTFNDYLAWRFVDGGVWLYREMMRYTLDFDLSHDEEAPLEHIINTLMSATVLLNDYYSWNKEYDHYMRTGGTMPLVNAVGVLKHLHGIDDNIKALELLRDQILGYEMQYCKLRDGYLRVEDPGANVRRFFGFLELGTAGTRFWHATSKRYNKSAPDPIRKLSHPVSHFGDTNSNGDKMTKTGLGNSAVDYEIPDEIPATKKKGRISNLQNTFDPFSFSQSGDDKIVLEPYKYTSSLPASNSRDSLLDALNCWYFVPNNSMAIIRHIIGIIHNTSLILDDIEDGSPVRRGFPSAHIVFGASQAINSATYQYVRCLQFVMALSKESIDCFTHTLSQLHIGQSQDLHWTFHCQAPSLDEYFKQTEYKTGGLFRMAAGMMRAEATKNYGLDTDKLMKTLGKYYQLRDDYNDLVPSTNGTKKNLDIAYNDLDQGSFTFPIIHALEKAVEEGDAELISILRSRKWNQGIISPETKKLAVKKIEDMGSFTYAKGVLYELHAEMERELGMLEKMAGMGENWILRLMLYRLKVI
ncbi:hypothetical protein EYC80_004766 [Monilinia laxa]|uniref:Geranyltranstransferase n=1 Tax=Monilinia laxa TaxID=61186 RepID=A0A5N6KHS1_MONLA|nr:hypothetical protein EYC80_004766 [Monilinia laxa]